MSNRKIMPNVTDQDYTDVVNDILGDLPSIDYVEVKLPSLGMGLYQLEDSVVHLRPMTFEDEKSLMSLKDKTQSLNHLLSKCLKEEINPRTLLLQDKLLLLHHLRAISVDKDYIVQIQCPNCRKISEITIDLLDTFPCKYAETPIPRTVEITLPTIKKKAKVKVLTSGELEDNPNIMFEHLWKFLVEIDGKDNPVVRTKVIEKLPRKDIHEIIKAAIQGDVGLDTRFNFVCSYCKHESLEQVEIDADFFISA